MTEAFLHHPGMTAEQIDDDKDEHDSKPLTRKFISLKGVMEEVNEVGSPIARVAARALVFDLMYLLARAEK